jgi:hypothetical protein
MNGEVHTGTNNSVSSFMSPAQYRVDLSAPAPGEVVSVEYELYSSMTGSTETGNDSSFLIGAGNTGFGTVGVMLSMNVQYAQFWFEMEDDAVSTDTCTVRIETN